MHVPNIPSPDEVIKHFLIAVLGPSSTIVALYLLVQSVWDWVDRSKGVARFGIRIFGTGRRVSGRLFELGVAGTVVGFVISIVVLALQAIWLGLSYLIGHGLTWFVIGDPSGMGSGTDWKSFIAGLRWDWISGVYVAWAAVTLLLTYQAASHTDREERASRAMTIFTVPLIIVGILSGLGAAIAGIAYAINPHDTFVREFPIKTMAVTAVVAGAYIVASRTIAKTPPLIVRVWRPIREGDPEAHYHPHSNPGYPSRVPASRRTTMTTMVIVGVAVLAIIIGTGLGGRHSNQITQSPPPAASEFPPRSIKLKCIPGGGGFYCKGTLHWASVLTLSVQGLTQEVIDRLCTEGYRSRWSQNMKGYPKNPPMCSNSYPIPNGPDFSFGNKYWEPSFQPPTRTGRWVIVWRLYDPSGRVVRSARYKVHVAFS